MIGIWFAAIYSFHHYSLDVLAGILCSVKALFIFNYILCEHNSTKEIVK